MALLRRRVGLVLLSGGACFLARLLFVSLAAQDQAPNLHELSLVARDFRWTPNRIELSQDDLIRLTIRSEDIAYSFAIDEYRIIRRIPEGASTTFEFRADRAGTFRFYCNLSDGNHGPMQGELVVRP